MPFLRFQILLGEGISHLVVVSVQKEVSHKLFPRGVFIDFDLNIMSHANKQMQVSFLVKVSR